MNSRTLLCGSVLLALTGGMLARAVQTERRGGAAGFPVGSLGGPGRTLGTAEEGQFERGRALFDENFHRSRGLGTPELNADSCRGCHQIPVIGGSGSLELNVSRFGKIDANGEFVNMPGGQAASKLRPPFFEGREEYPVASNVFEQRQTPPIFGLGLIDQIPDSAILAHEDPDDANGDGIRGVARRLEVAGATEIGRFGWKAQVPRLRDFVMDAMAGEIGITTPDDGRGFALLADADEVLDPELTDGEVEDVFFFMKELAAPERAGSEDPRVDLGEQIFETIGCAKCHVPSMPGPNGPVFLYSDLLLHDVMPPDFRGMAEPGADMGVFRTTPLWGLRHSAPYMHDGRASTPEKAIYAHDSEAARVRFAYKRLTPEEKEALNLFLLDL